MVKQYSAEFKMEAIKRVQNAGISVAKVAAELGVNESTLLTAVNIGWRSCARC